MRNYAEMKVTYIDPDQRALYVGELPDGGFGVWAQRGKAAPRKLVSKGYIQPDGYATAEAAQGALDLYVSNKEQEGPSWAAWEYYVNGKRCQSKNEMYAIARGELPVPATAPPDAMVTLAQIEYRIATHIQGAYENLLEVGHCLIEAKESGLVAHGEWEAWVRRNTHMNERSAQRLMQAARSVHAGSAMERLPISKIQAILALPESEREPMAKKADSEDMSLRELQAAVNKARAEERAKADKRVHDVALESAHLRNDLMTAKGEAAAAKSRYELASQQCEQEQKLVRQLETALDAATAAASASGSTAEAQAEIERLRADLAEAEAYAEQQAEQRQQAQRDMLVMRSQVARGELQGTADGLSAFDLAAAVRTFIGTVGVLPHMGATLGMIDAGERQQMTQYVDMVAAWVQDARRALGTVVVMA